GVRRASSRRRRARVAASDPIVATTVEHGREAAAAGRRAGLSFRRSRRRGAARGSAARCGVAGAAVSGEAAEPVQRAARRGGAWSDVELPVERAREIAFIARGPAGAIGFVGDPLLFARGGGAPGANLLLVIIDTLRADALPIMPRLQALGSRGVRFAQAITAA